MMKMKMKMNIMNKMIKNMKINKKMMIIEFLFLNFNFLKLKL
jgi:hypothetical protein